MIFLKLLILPLCFTVLEVIYLLSVIPVLNYTLEMWPKAIRKTHSLWFDSMDANMLLTYLMQTNFCQQGKVERVFFGKHVSPRFQV